MMQELEKKPAVFEQGPIRPPSEARSLLVRVTRNCPWNRCEFCPVYKGEKFEIRSVDEVKNDIRAMAYWSERAAAESWRLGYGGDLAGEGLQAVYRSSMGNPFLQAILIWMSGGGGTAFLQDANNIIVKPGDLVEMLEFLRATFPRIARVTSYARSQTLSKRSVEDLVAVRVAGLDRVHVGLESGSDRVLKMVQKGATADMHMEGGKKAKQAGMELSLYVMPGLGGRKFWRENALATARVLSEIDPHFIRLRSLGLRDGMPLFERVKSGDFELQNDIEIAREIRLMVENLEVSSILVSDHILNLLPEVEGKLPRDKPKILAAIDDFLALPEDDQLVYIVGRRFGLLADLKDLEDPERSAAARQALARARGAGNNDVHKTIRDIVSQFI